MSYKNKFRKMPPLMLPQRKTAYVRYNSYSYAHPLSQEYKKAAQALRRMEKDPKLTLENILLPNQNKFRNETYNLAIKTIQRRQEIDYLIEKFHIVSTNKFLDPWSARVIIADMLWGRQFTRAGSNEVEGLKYYEEDLRESIIELTCIIPNPIDRNKFMFPTYVRINTLSISIDDSYSAFCKEGWNPLPRCETYLEYLSVVSQLNGKNFMRDYHISELFVFPPKTSFYDHPGYVKGKFLLQDKGSCLSSFLLNPKPNSLVLDIFAAPGFKTNHLANIMENTGLIYANDIHPVRFEALKNLLSLTNVTCVTALNEGYSGLNLTDKDDIKYILIDPSSTYSGIFYEVGDHNQKSYLNNHKFKLSTILRFILQTYPNVKRVIYTICSIHPEECELVVDEVFKDIGDSYSLLDVRDMLWNEWKSVSLPGYKCANKCVRVIPEFDLCQGYFIAVFERNYDVPVPPYVKKIKKGSKLYTLDEVESVEKINLRGELTKIYVPKNKVAKVRKDPTTQIDPSKNYSSKKQIKRMKFMARMNFEAKKAAKAQTLKKPNPNLLQNVPRNLNVNPTAAATSSSYHSTLSQIYETTHSQLYP